MVGKKRTVGLCAGGTKVFDFDDYILIPSTTIPSHPKLRKLGKTLEQLSYGFLSSVLWNTECNEGKLGEIITTYYPEPVWGMELLFIRQWSQLEKKYC